MKAGIATVSTSVICTLLPTSQPPNILANILHKRNLFAYYTLLLEEIVIFRDSSGPEKWLEISGNSKVNICLFFSTNVQWRNTTVSSSHDYTVI